jgi:GNAT superfamily N-acetyltransferase
MYKSLDFNNGDINNSISGYVVTKEYNNWHNFLNEWCEDYADLLIKSIIDSEIENIYVLKNIFVDEDSRGCGIGTHLMNIFLEDVTCNDIVLLAADLQEEQMQGFNLVQWYENFNFYPITTTEDICLMASDNNNILSNVNDLIQASKTTKKQKLMHN